MYLFSPERFCCFWIFFLCCVYASSVFGRHEFLYIEKNSFQEAWELLTILIWFCVYAELFFSFNIECHLNSYSCMWLVIYMWCPNQVGLWDELSFLGYFTHIECLSLIIKFINKQACFSRKLEHFEIMLLWVTMFYWLNMSPFPIL